MTTINQLAAADEVTGSDQVPIYQAANGDARKASVSLFATYIQSLLTPAQGEETQYYSPAASGFSVTVAPTTAGGSVHLLMTPLAGYAAGTVVLPALAAAEDGQEVLVTSTQAITTLTVSGNGAVAVNGAPTAMLANAFFRLRYDGVTQSWYRIG